MDVHIGILIYALESKLIFLYALLNETSDFYQYK
jgi:hypothetical protein